MSRWSRAHLPALAGTGTERQTLIGAETGATHIQVDVLWLAAGEATERVTRFAESVLVVLAGTVTIEGTNLGALGPGGWAHVPVGVPFSVANAGDEPAQVVDAVCPQLRSSEIVPDERPSARLASGRAEDEARGGTVDLDAPLPPSPVPAFAVGNIEGATATSLVNASSGADHLVLLFIEYAAGGWMAPHDHPFEEAYVFLTGTMEGVIDGRPERFGPGDVLWTGVGNVHGFTNVGEVPARWIEIQSPLPPPRYGARFASAWA